MARVATMSGPSFHIRWPPSWYFQFPPATEPLTLPPSSEVRNFAAPFKIPTDFYQAALDWRVPVTIAAIYATTISFVNKYNRDRGNKAWPISKTRAFFAFVIAHNIFLAVFSALTCWGMLRSLAHTWPSYREYPLLGKSWPGLRTQNGLAGAADALCKMHGPRGFGDAVYYNPEEHQWVSKNKLISFAPNGEPDPSDVGRLWNEGLAFWGFWFYLSKFYEVLDTLIIVAKGKRSQTLQTYHHAGAMLCMWAGIRFMSPPIWMFVFINSGIHTMMYTYYTLSALGVKVPQRIKRTLTTMQILQFLIGFTFAAGHLFITYSVPVEAPYRVTSTMSSAVSAATSAASSAITSAATSGVGGWTGAWLKKVAFRAAGEEGLAENVRNDEGHFPGPESPKIEQIRSETKYRREYQPVPCIDTQGQAFAIYLNLLYLAPLTWLFVRFFIRAYTRRGAARHPPSKRSRRISESAHDAAHGVRRELETLGKAAEDGIGEVANNLKPESQTLNGSTPKSPDRRRVSQAIEDRLKTFESADEACSPNVNGSPRRSSGTLRKKPSEEHSNLRRMFEEGQAGRRGSPSPDSVRKPIRSSAESIKEDEDDESIASEAVEKLEEAATAAVEKTKQLVGSQSAATPGENEADSKSITEDDDNEIVEDAEGEAKEEQSQPQPQSRSTSPALSRESTRGSSPKKPSKIPRAISRDRSPAKKLTPQANGTRRSRTPEPIQEERRGIQENHHTNTNSQIPKPHSIQHRSSPSPTKGGSSAKTPLAKKIEAGDAPEFSEVIKEPPRATAGAQQDAGGNGGAQEQKSGTSFPQSSSDDRTREFPQKTEEFKARAEEPERSTWDGRPTPSPDSEEAKKGS